MSELELSKSKVLTAVGALTQVLENFKKNETLLDEVDLVQLQVCVKKIPPKDKTIKLKLPQSIRHSDLEVCLFVKDLDKVDRDYEPTVHHFKDLLRKKGINTVTDIIPLKSLKTEYKPYEAKRNLSNAYDIFIADSRIVRLLPTYLGKHFYGRKKTPVQVNLEAKDLAKEINAALDSSKCVISSKGASSIAVVGNMEMDQEAVAENVLAAASQISAGIAGGATNIKQLNIKTSRSVSIPIYMSEGGPQDISIPKEAKPGKVEAEEISTLFGAKVKVYPDGRILVVKDGEGNLPRRKGSKRPRKQQTGTHIVKSLKRKSFNPQKQDKKERRGAKTPIKKSLKQAKEKKEVHEKTPKKKSLKPVKQGLIQSKQKKELQDVKPPQAKRVKKGK